MSGYSDMVGASIVAMMLVSAVVGWLVIEAIIWLVWFLYRHIEWVW